MPYFPVFTRSGQVTVCLELTYPDITFNSEELEKMKQFHHFVFSKVLRLEKEPMVFDPENAECSYLVVPLNYGMLSILHGYVSIFCKSMNECVYMTRWL